MMPLANFRILRALLPLLLLGIAPILAGCNEEASAARGDGAAPPPPAVTVMEVEATPVELSFDYAGRVAAVREVEVRARVGGILLERRYEEGAEVKAGEVLFQIDPAPYKAARDQAAAQLQHEQATLAQAERDLKRAQTLLDRGAGTQRERDDALSAVELGKAAVAAAQASLDRAQLDLDYTTVTAPIDGVTSIENVSEGSLIGTTADTSLLTRITQLDPIYANFSFTAEEAAQIRAMMESGEVALREPGKLLVKVGDGSGKIFDGVVNFTDSTIDLQTGTIRARAVLPNSERRLLPGQFVRVTVTGLVLENAITIPEAAVMQGPQGTFVYVVNGENTAELRMVELGRQIDGGWLVHDGLQDGDRVVTVGVIKVRPGAPVTVAAPAAAPAAGGNTQRAEATK